VAVSLGGKGAFVRLVVSDDGTGFDLKRIHPGQPGKGGLGLLAMRERVACLGGRLTIRSGRRAGTRIEALVPV
jgi:signal transduction histidine kinase